MWMTALIALTVDMFSNFILVESMLGSTRHLEIINHYNVNNEIDVYFSDFSKF